MRATLVRLEHSSTSLDEALEQVSKGQVVEIQEKGVPLAVMFPATPQRSREMTVEEAIEGLRRIQERNTLGGLSLKSLIEEGRP